MKSDRSFPRLTIVIIFLCIALFLQRSAYNNDIQQREAMIDSLMLELMDSEMNLIYIAQMLERGSSAEKVHEYIEQLLGDHLERKSDQSRDRSEMQAELGSCVYDTIQSQPGSTEDPWQRVRLHTSERLPCSAP